MPTLLFLDTSSYTATIALSRDGVKLSASTLDDMHQQASHINKMIEEVTENSGIVLNEIDGIVVCAGPGSYTGLRVSMSTAKGLCYALDKPLLLYNKLFLLALTNMNDADNNLFVIMNARAEESFIAGYDAKLKEVIEPQHCLEKDIKKIIQQYSFDRILSDYNPELLNHENIEEVTHYIDIEKWIPFAENRWHYKQFDDIAYSQPFYLKQAFTTQPKKKI